MENNTPETCTDTNGCNTTAKYYSTHDYIGSLTEEQTRRCETVRSFCRDFETMLRSWPESQGRSFSARCVNTACTELERAAMYAIKAICFENKNVVGY